jgi:hypothetical protein
MSRIVKITESNLIKIIKNIINEESEGDNEYYDITPEQYYKLLVSVGNQAHAIPKLSMFKGKKVRVVGNLDLNSKPIKSLGNLTVTGRLSFPYTKIENLNGVEYGNLGSYYNTPYEKEIQRRRKQKEKNDADQRKVDDVWDLMDTDTEGEMAHAVFKYMVREGNIDELSYPEVEELITLKKKLKELEDRIEVETDDDVVDELTNDYDELQYEIDELEDKNNDVYGLVPDGSFWEMNEFKSIHGDAYGNRYAVGTFDEADDSLRGYYDDMVNDLSNFDRNTLSYHVDGDEVAEYFEDMIREWIYDDPNNYNVERTLSNLQEEEIKELKFEKRQLEAEIFLISYGIVVPIEFVNYNDNNWEFRDGVNNKVNLIVQRDGENKVLLNDTPTLNNPVYDDIDWDEMNDEISQRQEEIDDRINEIDYEIQDIEDSPDGDPDDDDVERETENILDEIKDDPIRWLDDYGVEYDNFINLRSLKEDLISESDYGILSSYDGTYDEIEINDNTYVVFRID